MSRLAVRDLGGYRDVQRVFENSVHEQRFTFLFTEADIEHAVSDEFKQEGERNIDAKIRYMEENFGDIIRQMTDDYDTTDREELVQSWRELFQHNNFHLVGNNEAFGLISLNLEEFFESFDDLEGSRQQQIDFLLGHELDHGDNYDAKSDGPKGLFSEVLSDRTGVSSIAEKHHPLVFWSSRVSQEDFERSVIAERIEHEITRALVYNEIGKWPDAERWDHNTGPFLSGESADPEAGLSEDAKTGLGELEKLVSAKGDTVLHEILERHYQIPSDPETLVYGSTILAGEFVDSFFTDVLDRMNIPEGRREEYEERYDDLDSDDFTGAHALLEDLREEFPEQAGPAVRLVFYNELFDDIEDLFEDPRLPPALVEHLETELEAIYNIEDEEFQAQAYADFTERFLQASPHAYQRYVYDEVPEVAVMTAIEVDPDAWEKTVEEIAAQIASQSEIEDPQMKRAFEIFIEERSLEFKPQETPVDVDPSFDRSALPGRGLEG